MVTPRFFPLMGGVETHVYEVGRRLAQAGERITILTTDPNGTLAREETLAGMRIVRVRAYPTNRDLYYAPDLPRVMTALQPTLVHCQGCHTLVPPLAMRAANQAHLPYLVTFHTGGHSSGLRNALRSAQWLAQRPLLAGARKLIGVSAFEARHFRDLLRLPAERFTVIPNGGQLIASPADSVLPGDADAGTLIVSTGRLERYKGHQHVIAALPTVLQAYPDARLLILGSGPYEAALRHLVARLGLTERVTIRAIPAGDRAAMAGILARARLVTLLSAYEAHPIAVMEALALGRPVLAFDTSGLRELADQGLIRVIAPHSSAKVVGQAIIDQVRAPLMPPAVPLPTWESCTTQVRMVYDAVLEQSACAS